MALHAVLEVIDPLLEMFLAHFPFTVFMTAITSVRRKTGRMTGGTGGAAAVIQRERVLAIEFGRRPGVRGMARGTIRSKLARMESRFGMAGNAGSIQSFEPPGGVTAFTRHVHVSAGQRELAQVMVEGRGLPALGGVALTAVRTETAFVRVVGMMTGIAVLESHREIAQTAGTQMALGTLHLDMLPGKLE